MLSKTDRINRYGNQNNRSFFYDKLIERLVIQGSVFLGAAISLLIALKVLGKK
jgi:hypothetical protein